MVYRPEISNTVIDLGTAIASDRYTLKAVLRRHDVDFDVNSWLFNGSSSEVVA